jgi:hypothetical protein
LRAQSTYYRHGLSFRARLCRRFVCAKPRSRSCRGRPDAALRNGCFSQSSHRDEREWP